MSAEIVAGVSDGRNGFVELDWAAREAQLRGDTLRLVRAYHHGTKMYPWESRVDAMITEDLRDHAQRRVEIALDHLKAAWPDVPVEISLVDGPAADVLIGYTATAALTVVGSRQLSALGATVIGSVSSAVTALANGPIVVAGASCGSLPANGFVVVGLDGLGNTDEVLGFAFDYAALHERDIHVLACIRHPLRRPGGAGHTADAELRRARAWLADTVGPWQNKYGGIDVRLSASPDEPVTALAAAAYGQEIVVLGGHRARVRSTAMIGSTRQGVLHHATCPVAVVHPRPAATE